MTFRSFLQNSHVEATGALDVHEETVGTLDQTLQLVSGELVSLGGVEHVFDLYRTGGRNYKKTASW